jgi:SecD/SecF fusion protein
MNVILEVSVVDVLRALSNYSADPTFNKAIERASELKVTNQGDFLTLFQRAFHEIDPNAKLAVIFNTFELRERIKLNSTNQEVIDVLRKEVNDAIDNSFNILTSRIDKFGVIQPNIQQLETKGRILVELPGVQDQKRVRKLLQGTANLEFYETYDNRDIFNQIVEAEKRVREYYSASNKTVKAQDSTSVKKEVAEAKKDSLTKNSLSALEKLKADSLKGGGDSIKNSLFAVLTPNIGPNQEPLGSSKIGYAQVKDTALVNKYLSLKPVRQLFPNNIRFYWTNKPSDITFENKKDGTAIEVYELHAIKTNKDGRPVLTGDVITSARPEYGHNKSDAEVSMSMNAEGTKNWARITKENLNKCIAVVMDQTVFSSPVVTSEITGGSSQISGMKNYAEANDLAIVLKSGKMPAPAKIIQEEIVGPSLGKENIQKSVISFIIAFIGVLLYMWAYYARAGNVANIALFANVFFLFGVFASMGLVLTLPGFAGIVLTLAMAVDGNVIIYERMREEMRSGKGPGQIVKDGFWHAYSAIIDGHVTTILTGVVLFFFGKGPVQGFATSLIAGLLLSLFTSIFVARLVFEWMLGRKMDITLGNKHTMNVMTKANFNFIDMRKIMYVVSIVIIVIGAVSLFSRGLDRSIDFTGGRTFIVRFDHAVNTNDLRESLTKTFESAPEVKTFGSENQVKITTNYLIENKSHSTDSIVDRKLYEGLAPHFKTKVSYDDFSFHSENKKVGELSSQRVDPVMSNELIYKAFQAVFFGLIIIFIYIAIRFRNWKYGLGGVIALAHDSFIVISMFSLFWNILPFSLEIDQTFIAAVLTIIGYSIMDTVIIFDRIREYTHLHPSWTLKDNINSAINHTLGRTVNTSGITVLVLVIMFFFGGDILRGFIFALLIGVISGTFSSVFTATPIAYDIIRLTEKKNLKNK